MIKITNRENNTCNAETAQVGKKTIKSLFVCVCVRKNERKRYERNAENYTCITWGRILVVRRGILKQDMDQDRERQRT